MPKCGSQCWFCDLPVRYDTYKGCSHGCKYCFAQGKRDIITKIEHGEGLQPLIDFVEGKRTNEITAFDWDIPLHIGGMSDPLQPCEKQERRTYNALRYLAKTQYPFVMSTKGELLIDPEYKELISQCNCVIQISMACSMYDKLEQGAPTFERRLEMLREISPLCKRSIVRVQPYFHEALGEILKNIPRYADAGAYGMICEGMKFRKRQKGLVQVGGDYAYPMDLLRRDFEKIKSAAHDNGLVFLCGENRLRAMGDSLTCCGVDGLEGFEPNRYNLAHLLNGDKQEPTARMREPGTANCFKACQQDTISTMGIAKMSYAQKLNEYAVKRQDYVKAVLGK